MKWIFGLVLIVPGIASADGAWTEQALSLPAAHFPRTRLQRQSEAFKKQWAYLERALSALASQPLATPLEWANKKESLFWSPQFEPDTLNILLNFRLGEHLLTDRRGPVALLHLHERNLTIETIYLNWVTGIGNELHDLRGLGLTTQLVKALTEALPPTYSIVFREVTHSKTFALLENVTEQFLTQRQRGPVKVGMALPSALESLQDLSLADRKVLIIQINDAVSQSTFGRMLRGLGYRTTLDWNIIVDPMNQYRIDIIGMKDPPAPLLPKQFGFVWDDSLWGQQHVLNRAS